MYYSTRMSNEGIIYEMEMLTNLFSQADIQVVALKGVCYALTIYPDIGLRPMADLDLLLPASKFPLAVGIAKSSGYVQTVPEASPGLRELLNHEIYLKKFAVPFTNLELHHSLVADRTYTYAVTVDWFWNQTELLVGQASNVRSENLFMLSPTAQVMYASAHAMLQHGGRNTTLRWYYDLDRLLRVYVKRIDWDELLSQAQTFNWGSALEAALSVTMAYFETPVPREVLVKLGKTSDRNRERVEMMQNRPESHTQEEYYKLKSLNWYGRFRLALALAIPSPAYMRWRYGLENSLTLPVWYLYRWGGIIIDVFKTVWKLTQKAFVQFGDSEGPLDESP
jgi:hypothetical protein